MKKTTKLLACISAITIMATGMTSTVNAGKTCWGYANGDINNKEYLEFLSQYEVSTVEDWLMEINWQHENEFKTYTQLHVYNANGALLFEYGKDNKRTITKGFFMGLGVTEENASVTKEELSTFLESKGINAKVDDVIVKTDENGNITGGVRISRADGDSEAESDYGYVAEAYCALSKEYGYVPNLIFEASLPNSFEEIDGDADGSGEVDVRDAALIANYLANGTELYDNADYNKDGKKNVRDAAAIAQYLAGN